MPRLTIAIDTETGGVSILHDDKLLEIMGTPPTHVERLSSIEYDNAAGAWTVSSCATGAVLFRGIRRDVCLEWEKRNVALLLAERRKGTVCTSTATTKS